MDVPEPYTPECLKRWERPDSYIGEQFYEYFIVLGRTRDSDLIKQSNFASALNMLGGESETVIVRRMLHWACGWVEAIMIHECDITHLKIGDDILKVLKITPFLDYDDYSARTDEVIMSLLSDIHEHPDLYPDAPTDEDELYEYAVKYAEEL